MKLLPLQNTHILLARIDTNLALPMLPSQPAAREAFQEFCYASPLLAQSAMSKAYDGENT
jgi:hypothetical protein